ncbi:MFS transporter [Paenibacillus sp. TAB 01]|uniref:MFS transporter n=1 Tax=Paenibacillus sp. TAB 01 TaxID=3368988 RepID=UPI0037527252
MKEQVRSYGSLGSRTARGMLLLGLSLGYFMVLLDMTVVTVALPAIRQTLGGGLVGLQWVVNAYTIVFAGLLLAMGALCDRLGAKRVYLGGLGLFLAASALSAASGSLGMLIAMRALLGAGGAALMPASLALLSHRFQEPAQKARALGVWAAVTGTAMAAGPVAGGFLADLLGWRSIFMLQVPLALISFMITAVLIRETPRRPGQGMDIGGQLAAAAGVVSLSLAIMEGQEWGWGSPWVLAAWTAAVLSLAVFIRLEAKGRMPMLPLTLFRSPTISAGMLAGMLVNIALSGILFVIPLYFQQGLGYSAHAAGLILLPMTIPMAVNPVLTGRLVSRIGARAPMTAGFMLAACGTLLQAGGMDGAYHGLMLAGLLLTGFGISLTIPALMAAVIGASPKELTGAASGALHTSRQLGAAIGVAVLGAIINGSVTWSDGMHSGLFAAAALLLLGGVLSFAYIGTKRRDSAAGEEAAR